MSKAADASLRGMHTGKAGAADGLFLKKNCIAVGWVTMGDLATLKLAPDAYKVRGHKCIQGKKPTPPGATGRCGEAVWKVLPSRNFICLTRMGIANL